METPIKAAAAEEKAAVQGNFSLVSVEEEAMAAMLRDRNLAFTNTNSKEVHPKDTFYTRYGKRILDIMISLPAFLVLLPVNLVLGICTYFDVGRPIFYKQTRAGLNGKMFTMIKFRNMTNDTDADGKLLPAAQRVTKFGKFVRKTSLDELLNFWNVLKGDMSIIGPRPVPVFYVERMSERHKMRNAVKPGLECPRVIERGDENISLYHWKFENDMWYVENVSFKTDIMLMWLLVKMTLSVKKRSVNAGRASYFVGYDDEGRATSLTKAKERYNLELE